MTTNGGLRFRKLKSPGCYDFWSVKRGSVFIGGVVGRNPYFFQTPERALVSRQELILISQFIENKEKQK